MQMKEFYDQKKSRIDDLHSLMTMTQIFGTFFN